LGGLREEERSGNTRTYRERERERQGVFLRKMEIIGEVVEKRLN